MAGLGMQSISTLSSTWVSSFPLSNISTEVLKPVILTSNSKPIFLRCSHAFNRTVGNFKKPSPWRINSFTPTWDPDWGAEEPSDIVTYESEMRQAAEEMVDMYVRSGMVIGLGCGPWSKMAIKHLSKKIRDGKVSNLTSIPMSSLSASQAANEGIPLANFVAGTQIDFAFTDADLVQEGTLFSIIGRRGILGRESVIEEKEIAKSTKEFVVLTAEKSFVEKLDGPIPVEISQEDWLETAEEIDDCFLGDAEVWRRPSSGTSGPMGGDNPLMTRRGNYVLDLVFTTEIEKIGEVVDSLESIPGVVEHGVLLDGVDVVFVGGKSGVTVRTSRFKEAFL